LRIVAGLRKVEQCKTLKAGVSLRFIVSGWEFGSRYSQSVVLLLAFCVDYPARQDGQAFFYIGIFNAVEVKPLAAGVRTGELLGEQFSGARIGFPGDMPRRVSGVEVAQTRKVLFATRVVLPVAMR
jgi:hypothetical protein